MPNIKNILIIVPVIALFWVWNVYGRTPAAPLTTLAATNLHTLSANLADTKADAAETTSTQSQTTKPVNAIVVTGDPDLKPENIKKGVSIFGVDGKLLAGVPRTGQTKCYTYKDNPQYDKSKPPSYNNLKYIYEEDNECNKSNTKDDGKFKKGAELPKPRFTLRGDNNNNGKCDAGETCDVIDHLTGLIWLSDANCAGATATWGQAFEWVKELNDQNNGGKMNGKDCKTNHRDWRLPNVRELQSLVDYGHDKDEPALPSGHPFTNVQPSYYWSSSTNSDKPYKAWFVGLHNGFVYRANKADANYVWPVRGGQ